MVVAEREGLITGRDALREGALPNAFIYTGRHWDPVARLYHYRARAYDPDTGSFLQHDPIPADNPYAYTDNNPLNFTDPLGLSKKQCEEYTRVSATQVCFGMKCEPLSYLSRTYKSLKSSCNTAGYKFQYEFLYSRGGCSKCFPRDKTQSCEELCSRFPLSPDCLEKCKEKNELIGQDNPNGSGSNDNDTSFDITPAPDETRCYNDKMYQTRDQCLIYYYRR